MDEVPDWSKIQKLSSIFSSHCYKHHSYHLYDITKKTLHLASFMDNSNLTLTLLKPGGGQIVPPPLPRICL